MSNASDAYLVPVEVAEEADCLVPLRISAADSIAVPRYLVAAQQYGACTVGLGALGVRGVVGDPPSETIAILAPRLNSDANKFVFPDTLTGVPNFVAIMSPSKTFSNYDSSGRSRHPSTPRMSSSSSASFPLPPLSLVSEVSSLPFTSTDGCILLCVVHHTSPFATGLRRCIGYRTFGTSGLVGGGVYLGLKPVGCHQGSV
ncbi:unnamed protein product [Phytophthora fragariaefolia]|uniref:Unnamed protein product n=1 Tax=Phytophthora fragariaefolia TaxID=1490495 RepID=A0A9W6TKS6_9STRA|nr:unnamed protein product [Phytophthora fragariaefolia]